MNHRLNNPDRPRLVREQRAASRNIANLACRAAHVDIDDLGPAFDIEARGQGQHFSVATSQLNRSRLCFPLMVNAARRFDAIPQAGVGSGHFRDSVTRAQRPAELAKGPISHARHGRYENTVGKMVSADLHGICRCNLFRRPADRLWLLGGAQLYRMASLVRHPHWPGGCRWCPSCQTQLANCRARV